MLEGAGLCDSKKVPSCLVEAHCNGKEVGVVCVLRVPPWSVGQPLFFLLIVFPMKSLDQSLGCNFLFLFSAPLDFVFLGWLPPCRLCWAESFKLAVKCTWVYRGEGLVETCSSRVGQIV